MSWAHVIDNKIERVVSQPSNLRRLADAASVLYGPYITAAELAACGWFEVVDERPEPGANEVVESGDVELVDGVPTQIYTTRAKTAEELAAEAAERAAQTERDQAKAAVANLDQYLALPSPTNVDIKRAVDFLAKVARRLIIDQYGKS